jgi:hypothetical protein
MYKDREYVDCGGGSGWTVTNSAISPGEACHSTDFYFCHAEYANFKGTYLCWNYMSFIIDNNKIPESELNKYTDRQCMELVLKYIPVNEILCLLRKIKQRAYYDGRADLKEEFRKLIY